MTTKTVDRVTAKFGGRDLTFMIARDKIPYFEMIIKEPAQIRLRRLVTGAATVKDIREVLEYAAPDGVGRAIPPADKTPGHQELVEMRFALEALRPKPKSFVATTLEENPPLKYAVLAQGVLAAALMGIPESAAHFDEDEEDSADGA